MILASGIMQYSKQTFLKLDIGLVTTLANLIAISIKVFVSEKNPSTFIKSSYDNIKFLLFRYNYK